MSEAPVPKIAASGVRKSFGRKRVLDGIEISCGAGESLVIIGGSGTGKSVLIKCILGLLRPDAGTFLAYNQQCTHLCCAVVPKLEKGCLECPCHKGSFDLQTGRPIAGPPRRPLSRIQLEIRNGVVHATGVERRTV